MEDIKLPFNPLQEIEQQINDTLKKSGIKDPVISGFTGDIIDINFKEIQNKYQDYMNKIFERYCMTEDLESWYENHFQTISDVYKYQPLTRLINSSSKIEKRQGEKINAIFNFMFYLSLILQFEIKTIFKLDSLLKDSEYLYKPFVSDLNKQIIQEFEKRYKDDYKQCKKVIEKIHKEIQANVEKKIKENFKKQFQIEEPIQFYQKQRQFITHEYEIKISEHYNLNRKVIRYIFSDELHNTYAKTNEYFNQCLVDKKSDFITHQNEIFTIAMQNLPLNTILDAYQLKNTNLTSDHIAAILIKNVSYSSEEDKKLLLNCLKQLEDLSYDFSNFEQIQNFQFEINELCTQFYKELKQLHDQDVPLFYKILTMLYLLVTNVQVTKNTINFHEYYGYYHKHRISILNDIKKQTQIEKTSYFFNFLDYYFEKYVIFPCKTTYSNKSFNVNINAGLRYDYSILKQMRLEKQYDFQAYEELFGKEIFKIKNQFSLPEVPEHMHLIKVSKNEIISRHIVIAVSGFTTEAIDKKVLWENLASLYPNSEVYALQYRCKKGMDIMIALGKTAAIVGFSYFTGPLGKLANLCAGVLASSKYDNPFTEAWKQADLVGMYLAYLLHENRLFAQNSVSLVGFSLGTQVINSCLYQYKKLISESKIPSQIATVCMFGGVADINFIKKQQLTSCIGYQLYNCYCKNDMILRIVLRTVNYYSYPAGLYQIEEENKIINFDFTETIDGHTDYMDNHPILMQKIDFNSELLGTLDNQHLQSHLSFSNTQFENLQNNINYYN